MNKPKINLVTFYILIFMIGFTTSCKIDDEEIVVETPDQLFSPVLFRAEVNINSVYFSWTPILNSTYLIEISRDNMLFENDLKSFTVTDKSEFHIENLWSNSLYSARIKAISKDTTIKDSKFQKLTFITKTENIFYNVPADSISTNSVVLQWDQQKQVSHIIVSLGDVDQFNYVLESDEIAAGKKKITNLSELSEYKFKIYFGEMLRGTIAVKTK